MAQLAEDLSLLGLPFLLSKAAEAASEFEASGCESAASAYVRAAFALKSLLNHPELAALEEDATHMVPDHSNQAHESLNTEEGAAHTSWAVKSASIIHAEQTCCIKVALPPRYGKISNCWKLKPALKLSVYQLL